MNVQELIDRLAEWNPDDEVRVQIDGNEGVIEDVNYLAAHDEGFVVILATEVLDD